MGNERVYALNDCVTDVSVDGCLFIVFRLLFGERNRRSNKTAAASCGIVAAGCITWKKLSWCRAPSAQRKKKGSCSDKRKKEGGVVAGESGVRRDSSERQTLQTPAAALSLSAAGDEAGDAAWSDLILESREPLELDSVPLKQQEQGSGLKGGFLFDFHCFSKRHDSSETVRKRTGLLPDWHGSYCAAIQ